MANEIMAFKSPFEALRLFAWRRTVLTTCLAIAAISFLAVNGGDVSAEDQTTPTEPPVVVKQSLQISFADEGVNLLSSDAWRPWEMGYDGPSDGVFTCRNEEGRRADRGVAQTVQLNQTEPHPIVAVASSRAESVSGSANNGYSLYLDLTYMDGTNLWGQTSPFSVGSHNWETRQVVVIPEKPVRSVSFYVLFRGHGGLAEFREMRLMERRTPSGSFLFDGTPVTLSTTVEEGFQIRDQAAGSHIYAMEPDGETLGVELSVERREGEGAAIIDATLTSDGTQDRALTLYYSIPFPKNYLDELRWLDDPRRETPVGEHGELMNATNWRVGSRRLSRYPFGAVANDEHGLALGIDITRPAFYRVGFNAGTSELFLAYDIALTPEKPMITLRFVRFSFDSEWGFRSALSRYYELFPEQFDCRTPEQGLWMPFAKISDLPDWEDFGFKFKEGNNETAWDDVNGITTFRYTEPMTWWMKLPEGSPRTMEVAEAEAQRLAEETNDPRAVSFFTSGFRDREGRLVGQMRDTPWCDGIVWSMNSSPGIPGEVNDFSNKWNPTIQERYYGPNRSSDLDGEYVDSSECYVTADLDFAREHFAASETPLCWSSDDHSPGIFKNLAAFEYARGIEEDVHAMGRLMMANSTPSRVCWLTPLLDVAGTETNWNHGGRWSPMSDAELLYRRSLCNGKPYCFLMNTPFEDFSHERVEAYMKRCLAYGMFPGFFSHNASEGHYFTRPELYERDRSLFKKYVPLCRLVAETGWKPMTMAHTNDEHVYIERFGQRTFTLLNDSSESRSFSVILDDDLAFSGETIDLTTGRTLTWREGRVHVTLGAEDVAVFQIP
jgi:hypothetical protein